MQKTPEDEAFDDLAKRQGDWGGGYPAKKAMAADKLQEPAKEPVSFPCCGYTDANAIRWNQFNGVVQCHMCGQVYTVAQPAQEPTSGDYALGYAEGFNDACKKQAQEPVRLWCETCEGTGEVYQEHQAGCHVGGNFKCPDCDGQGYILSRLYSTTPPPPAQKPVAWRVWNPDGDNQYLYSEDGDGEPLYTPPPQRERVVFPTMLRKMWSGGEVQAWLDENVNKEKNT